MPYRSAMPLNFLPAQAEIIVPMPEKNGMTFRIKQKMAKPRESFTTDSLYAIFDLTFRSLIL